MASKPQHKRSITLLVAAAAVAVALIAMPAAPLQEPVQNAEHHSDQASISASVTEGASLDQETQAEYDSSSVIAVFDQDASADAVNESLASVASIVEQKVAPADFDAGFAEFTIAEGATVESAVAELGRVSGIASSQPNFIYHLLDDGPAATAENGSLSAGILSTLATTINDARHADQWYLDAAHGVNAFNAWDLEKVDGSVTVAVIDSGCSYEHEDLAGNYIQGYDASGSGIGDISTDSHGTHVCGIVAAVANNGIGIAGTTYNAKFLPIQAFYWDSNGNMNSNTSCLLKAYNYVLEHAQENNIRVINMSLGGPRSPSQVESNGNDKAVLRKIEEAYSAGIVTVCAAGNNKNATPPYYIFPGDYLTDKHGFNVIALDKNHNKPDYSNYNAESQTTKDIAGPGGNDNTSSSTSGNRILSTSKSGYAELYGTSMASPIVSSVAALVFAANPSLSPGQVVDIIHSTATDVGTSGFDAKTGYGLVNAYEAVKCAKATLGSSADEIMVGQTARFTPSSSVAGSWDWNSSDTSVATVNNGVATGTGPGQTTISASRGSFSLNKAITVYSASIAGNSTVRVGSSAGLALTATPAGGTWRWSSSNTQVATVSNGTVTGISAGSATITASLEGNDSIKATFDVTVEKQPQQPTRSASSTTSTSASSTTRSSSQTTSSSSSSKPSTSSSTASSSRSSSSTASSSSSASSSRSSSSSSSSSSSTSSPDVANATIDAIRSYTYTGRPIKPIPKVRIDGVILNPDHYSVSYANATRVGTATVTVKGIGDYQKLQVSKKYKITKASQKISVKASTATARQTTTRYHSSIVRCINQVTGKKTQLIYKKKGGSNKLLVSGTTGLITITKGTKKGTYKATVAVFAKASENYKKSNTVTKTLTVKVQ